MSLKLNSPKKIFTFFNNHKEYYTFINNNRQFFNNTIFKKDFFCSLKKEIFTLFFLDADFQFITMLHQMGDAEKIKVDYRKVLFYALIISFHQNNFLKNNFTINSIISNFSFNGNDSFRNFFYNKKNTQQQKIKIVFLHNHTSKVLLPSKKDLIFTKKNKAILKMIGVELIDHLIYDEKDFFSFSKNKVIV